MLRKLLAELRHQHANQSVVTGIVIGRTPQHVHSDLLLPQGAIRVLESPISQIQKQFAKALRFLELRAGGDSIQQFPRLHLRRDRIATHSNESPLVP